MASCASALVDDYSSEGLALIADTSISAMRVARELDLAILERLVKPAMVVSDNGTELTSMAILRWVRDRDVEWHYVAPGKPGLSVILCARSVSFIRP